MFTAQSKRVILGWFTRAGSRALLLAQDIEVLSDMAHGLAVSAILYEASHHLHRPRLVNITLSDAGEVSGLSGITVGVVRARFFSETEGESG